MKLHAISDLHLAAEANRAALAEIHARPDDWLILAGDVGETEAHLQFAFDALQPKFKRLVWLPGNHELWALPSGTPLRGVARYERFVALCRARGVLTPEDPYPVETFGGRTVRIAPLFTLYDYSFRPDDVARDEVVAWARETGVGCADEYLLRPDPYPDRDAWCRARCAETEARLAEAAADGGPLVLANHWPLVEALARAPRIPRFAPWCGTRLTADWHRRFNACAVVSGHLHLRSERRIDGVPFHEVSLGNPREWQGRRAPDECVRLILG
ncbi:3',5'-cyclic AMP phosphodiesterase CpdA [Methylopila capsulata]|uniref:3',5'-cyclic AMP phosphodiesterase CpdA n=1 Tax=Methylopila capsulata TaxID=61654 RepID=A0A9W6MTC2_9HYPH|nr:metallophosphoesterase [Methylopila capsulata]MBM7852906.1 3',5'-cyclic AMP phosphodiesterase CpdA [Methylopila capsulata]GLK57117.1 metallophosphoesterase [Methylopila capsulata]